MDGAQLRAVLEGSDPTGTYRLSAAHNRRVIGYDLTFSAPKSVSVLWGLSTDQVRGAVAAAHERAVAAALGYIEAEAILTRRGHNGTEVIATKGMIAAGFRHRTSRNGDPHLHTHVVVANMVEGVDGRWATLDGRQLYAHARTAGFLYQTELRHQLTATLGVAWSPVQRGTAEIDGMPASWLRAFSTRRAEIEARLELVGQSSPAAAQIAVLATRRTKHDVDTAALGERWRKRAIEVGYDPELLAHLIGRASPLALTADHAIAIETHLVSAAGLTAKASTFDRRDVVRALAELVPTGLTADIVQRWADAFLQRHDIVALHNRAGVTYSTRELVELETRLVATAVARINEGVAVVPSSRVFSVLRQYRTIEDEQSRLVLRLTTSGNGVDIVVAAAGTGKTYALGCAADIWQRTGHHVQGAALAGRAAQELETTAHIPSVTIARFTKELQRRPLTPRDVIVIDEAGMAGTRALAPILDAAAAGGAKVVLVGDHHQLPEIEAGGLLRGLASRITPIELQENRRQHEPWEQRALVELRNGDVERALNAYADNGRIHTAPDASSCKQQLVEAWLDATRGGDHSIMLATRVADAADLNQLARKRLAEIEMLRGRELTIGDRKFQAGDRIIALRNDYDLDVRNGTLATVTKVHSRRGDLTVRTDAGATRRLSAGYLEAGHVDHGYAITIHKAQGLTADRSFVLGTDDLYRELGYVALSRGRLSNDLYVAQPEPREHAHRLERPPGQRLAHTLATDHQQTLGIDR